MVDHPRQRLAAPLADRMGCQVGGGQAAPRLQAPWSRRPGGLVPGAAEMLRTVSVAREGLPWAPQVPACSRQSRHQICAQLYWAAPDLWLAPASWATPPPLARSLAAGRSLFSARAGRLGCSSSSARTGCSDRSRFQARTGHAGLTPAATRARDARVTPRKWLARRAWNSRT